jgi:hypothetical protein
LFFFRCPSRRSNFCVVVGSAGNLPIPAKLPVNRWDTTLQKCSIVVDRLISEYRSSRTRSNMIWKQQKFSCLYPKYTNLDRCSIPTLSFFSIFFGAPASHRPFLVWVLRGSPTGWTWSRDTKHKPSQISVTLLVQVEAVLLAVGLLGATASRCAKNQGTLT